MRVLQRQENPEVYEHLTKYNSKKKKSEMTSSCEVFARQEHDDKGMGKMKVKIEMCQQENDSSLKVTSIKGECSLQVTVY